MRLLTPSGSDHPSKNQPGTRCQSQHSEHSRRWAESEPPCARRLWLHYGRCQQASGTVPPIQIRKPDLIVDAVAGQEFQRGWVGRDNEFGGSHVRNPQFSRSKPAMRSRPGTFQQFGRKLPDPRPGSGPPNRHRSLPRHALLRFSSYHPISTRKAPTGDKLSVVSWQQGPKVLI